MKPRDAERSKNFFALGLVSLDVHPAQSNPRSPGSTRSSPARPAGRRGQRRRVQGRARLRRDRRAVRAPLRGAAGAARRPAPTPTSPATRRWPGAWSRRASWPKLPAVPRARYPITPASDILHELSKHKNFGVRTLQAEDEIAGIGAALGAAFGGHLAVTTTSGPGIALKGETIGLAVSLELPLVIVDIQRGGPSTGLPTKTEQADLLMAMYGRHGESPLPIVAAYSPAHCFDAAIEAARIALKYRTPVILLSDGYLANGSEPWRLPDVADLPDISVEFATEPNHTDADGEPEFWPYLRDPDTLARPWAMPGTPGLDAPHRRHREGGRHRQHLLRPGQPRAHGPPAGPPRSPASPTTSRPSRCVGDVDDAEILVLGWGSTWGAIDGAVNRVRAQRVTRSPTPTSRT